MPFRDLNDITLPEDLALAMEARFWAEPAPAAVTEDDQ